MLDQCHQGQWKALAVLNVLGYLEAEAEVLVEVLVMVTAEVEVEEARTPWSTEAMTEEAREKLLGYGVAPPLPLPMAGEDPPCPRCGSREVVLKNPFGATLCKTLYQCAACGEVFEAFKTV